jgi:serine/threonine-protein kinase
MQPQAVHFGAQQSRASQSRVARLAPETQSGTVYRVTRCIHRSSTFELFRAAARGELGPGCCLVKTPKKGTLRELAIAMLRREARVAAEVQHPNLNCVLAAELRSDEPHLLLPFRDGVSLRQLLRSSGSLNSIPRALNIVRQVAEALAALHGAGWLHGHVRPEHILLSPQGQATLIDLTLARQLETAECDLTGAAGFSATYAAPEIAVSNRRVTSAADGYSLGIVLYEAVVGRTPFEGISPREVLHQHRCDAIPDIRGSRPDVSLEVAYLFRRMLAKEPLRRPSDGELRRWLAELEIAAL